MGALRKLMPITAARSSSAGWPSPACRRSPASGARTRSSLAACDKSPVAVGRRPGHRAAHRVLHDPSGDHGLLRRGPLARRPRGARRARRSQAAREPVDDGRSRSSCSPCCRSSAASSTCRSATSTERLATWLEPVRRRARDHRHGRSLPLALIAVAIGASLGIGVAVRRVLPQEGEGGRAEDPRRRLVLRPSGQRRSWAGPAVTAFEGVAWVDAHIIDGAVNGAGATGARRTAGEVRKVQSGYVRNYAAAHRCRRRAAARLVRHRAGASCDRLPDPHAAGRSCRPSARCWWRSCPTASPTW